MPAKKSNTAEIEVRVTKVLDLLCMGLTRAEIIQFGSKEWGIVPRQSDEYIAKANVELKKRAAFDRDAEFAKAKERLNWLYKKCIAVQDFQRALAVQKELNALNGLYPAAKMEQSGEITVVVKRVKDNGSNNSNG